MSTAEKLTAIAENEQKVYEAGKEKVLRDMWEGLQKGGKRSDYGKAFFETSINDEMFKPIYDMQPTNAYSMFFGNVGITDLRNIPVKLDFSQCEEIQYAFYGMMNTDVGIGIKHIGVIDCRSIKTWIGNLGGLFAWDIYLEDIEKIILPNTGEITFPSTFEACYALKEIRFEGVIGQNINFADCPLSKESIVSVINALSPSVSGKTLSLNIHAKDSAFTDSEWNTLTGTRSNWIIELV